MQQKVASRQKAIRTKAYRRSAATELMEFFFDRSTTRSAQRLRTWYGRTCSRVSKRRSCG